MADENPQTRRMMLEAGSLVILHPDGPAGGFPMVVSVDQVSRGEHWFLGAIAPLKKGETLIVERPIENDARYATRATIVGASPETFALRLDDDWERVQQRAFVRISAHGLQVRIVRLSPQADLEDESEDVTSGDAIHELIDLSAGGIRFSDGPSYEPGEEVICHFELPGSLCFVLPARILRSPEAETETETRMPTKDFVACEFVGLDEATRSQLLRWVYREQVRRHRDSSRREAKDAERAQKRTK